MEKFSSQKTLLKTASWVSCAAGFAKVCQIKKIDQED